MALVCLTSQASAVAHLVFVAHVACAEHGELIDTGAAEGRGQPVAPGASERGLSSDQPPPPHSHDHCAAATVRRDPARPLVRALVLATPAVATRPAVAAAAQRDRSRDVLAVAPKASPPA